MSTLPAPQEPDEPFLPALIGSEDDAPSAGASTAGHRRSPWPPFLVAFVAGLILALVAGAGALYAFDRQYADRVMPGVRVGGVELAGLDRTAARSRLAGALGVAGAGKIELQTAHGTQTITYADIGRAPDLDGLVDEAFAIGRTGDFLSQTVDTVQAATQGVDLAARMTIDSQALAARLATIAGATDQAPVDAQVVASASGFTVKPSAKGRGLDQPAIARLIKERLVDPAAPSLLSVAGLYVPTEPNVTDAEAQDAAMAAGRITAQDLVLTLGSDQWRIPASSIRPWVSFQLTTDGRYVPTVSPTAAQKTIAGLAKKINRAPTEATFLVGKNGLVVGATASKDGRAVDVPATAAAVASALEARAPWGFALPVTLAASVTPPKLSTQQAEAVVPLMTRLSSWTTHYVPSERNGNGVNITIPARTIDGTVVAPGSVFDFWQAVGEVSRAKGYTDGGAIIDGHTEPTGALAGGICSASTTLFNAAARAGLELLSRTNHYYYINRYPVGLDATVFISASGSKVTMSFRNDTQYPILIRGYASPGIVTFELYGVPTGRTAVFSAPIVKNLQKSIETTQPSDTIPVGTTKRIEYPVDGFDAWVTRTVTDKNGTIIHRETFYSHYARIDGLTLVGAPPSPSTSPKPSPSSPPSTTPSPTPSPTPTH